MVAVGFLGVRGALGPAHGQPGDAEGGDVGKIVDRVVEQGDRAAEKATDDFGGYEAQRCSHGPGEDRGAHSRVLVAVMWTAVTMAVAVIGMSGASGGADLAGRAVVILFVRMRIHRRHLYSSCCGSRLRTLLSCLVDTLTRYVAILLTVPPPDCHHHLRQAIFSVQRAGVSCAPFRILNHERSRRQIEFLGCTRSHANGGPGDVALRREHALPRVDRSGWHANYFGLRHGVADARQSIGCGEWRPRAGDTHLCYPLSLGSHPGDSIFRSVVRGKK